MSTYLSDRLFIALAKRIGFPCRETLRPFRARQMQLVRQGTSLSLFSVARWGGLLDEDQAIAFLDCGRVVAATDARYAGGVIDAQAQVEDDLPEGLELLPDEFDLAGLEPLPDPQWSARGSEDGVLEAILHEVESQTERPSHETFDPWASTLGRLEQPAGMTSHAEELSLVPEAPLAPDTDAFDLSADTGDLVPATAEADELDPFGYLGQGPVSVEIAAPLGIQSTVDAFDHAEDWSVRSAHLGDSGVLRVDDGLRPDATLFSVPAWDAELEAIEADDAGSSGPLEVCAVWEPEPAGDVLAFALDSTANLVPAAGDLFGESHEDLYAALTSRSTSRRSA